MQEVVIRIWDDLAARNGEKVEAARTVAIGLDGRWVELDLSAENADAILGKFEEWMSAGRAVKEAPQPQRRAIEAPAGEKKEQWKVREWEHGRAWGDAVREFARANGLSYMTSTGKYYYSRTLRDAYARSIGRE
jgi:hypothetical protein